MSNIAPRGARIPKIDSHFSPIQPPFSHAKLRNWANVLEEHSQGVVRNRKCPFVYNNTHRERKVLNPRLRWSRVVSCAIRKSHTKVFLVVAVRLSRCLSHVRDDDGGY